MGNPLSCLLPEDQSSSLVTGKSLPLFRLKSLVSMTTPRDVGRNDQDAFFSPPFVEFDMQPEGFGCLFLPSVAPQCHANNVSNLSGAGTGLIIMGGVGSGGDRIFPAQTGMSFSTWICVDKFSDPRLDPHGIIMHIRYYSFTSSSNCTSSLFIFKKKQTLNLVSIINFFFFRN